MPLEGFGKLYNHAKGKMVLYLPAAIANDSAFPFKKGVKLRIRIVRETLVVDKPKG